MAARPRNEETNGEFPILPLCHPLLCCPVSGFWVNPKGSAPTFSTNSFFYSYNIELKSFSFYNIKGISHNQRFLRVAIIIISNYSPMASISKLTTPSPGASSLSEALRHRSSQNQKCFFLAFHRSPTNSKTNLSASLRTPHSLPLKTSLRLVFSDRLFFFTCQIMISCFYIHDLSLAHHMHRFFIFFN